MLQLESGQRVQSFVLFDVFKGQATREAITSWKRIIVLPNIFPTAIQIFPNQWKS